MVRFTQLHMLYCAAGLKKYPVVPGEVIVGKVYGN